MKGYLIIGKMAGATFGAFAIEAFCRGQILVGMFWVLVGILCVELGR